MIHNFEYVRGDLNMPDLEIYLKSFIQQSLKNPYTCDLNEDDFVPAVPELYLAKWMLGTCMIIVEKLKKRIETVSSPECNKCHRTMEENITSFSNGCEVNQVKHKMRGQSGLNMQELKGSDSPQRNIKRERAPLTPMKDTSNISKVLSSPYFSPKQLEQKTKFAGKTSLETQDNVKNAVGSPVHCSTQMHGRCHLENIQFDENMKIKNSSTPKKKKISPVKIVASNSIISQQQPFNVKLEQYLNDSDDSLDILPATPNSDPRKTFPKCLNSKKSKEKINEVTEDDEEIVLTPLIKRLSEPEHDEGVSTPEKTEFNFEDPTEGISPSIIQPHSMRRNLMTDSLESSNIKSFTAPSPITVPTQETESLNPKHSSDESKQQSKNNREWVKHNGSSNLSTSFVKSNSSFGFKHPVARDKKYKQMTLLQMKKKSPIKCVDISTLTEFKGGVRPATNKKTSCKRKSDESDRENECTLNLNSKVPDAAFEADETFFPASPPTVTHIKEQKVPNRQYKKGKADTNFTEDLIANFDKLPSRGSQEPDFAYKPEKAVRKRDERAKLTGRDCEDCRGYFDAIDSNADPTFVQKMKNACSKHRSKHLVNLNGTPEGYWETDFPSTLEAKQQRILNMDTYIDSD